MRMVMTMTIGTLSSDDDKGNENNKQTLALHVRYYPASRDPFDLPRKPFLFPIFLGRSKGSVLAGLCVCRYKLWYISFPSSAE